MPIPSGASERKTRWTWKVKAKRLEGKTAKTGENYQKRGRKGHPERKTFQASEPQPNAEFANFCAIFCFFPVFLGIYPGFRRFLEIRPCRVPLPTFERPARLSD
jgi:hypothetical protein